jgi:GNAT superfamily N-acetyltransferase
VLRACDARDFETIHAIINEAAEAYRGVIPHDRWKEPYMSRTELIEEIEAGVAFWGYEADGGLIGVMGAQPRGDVTLIRHAYTRRSRQREGIGGRLLEYLRERAGAPLLVGTWEAATWAIAFYERHGFQRVARAEAALLLRRYWTIPERQVQTSVVLADRPLPDRAG